MWKVWAFYVVKKDNKFNLVNEQNGGITFRNWYDKLLPLGHDYIKCRCDNEKMVVNILLWGLS